ncbi:MAG: terpene cyclase/mutase family protein [Phaeodactylibacter sp.]|nr:terpene cyclase/mutase family protein [Phaeodactylibacter sp.]
MTNPKPIAQTAFSRRSSEGLAWLKRSMDANKGNGASAFYAFWRYPWRKGWAPPYPETTGYIIETLLDYHPVFHWDWLQDYARSSAEWLLTKQLDSGAFPALFGQDARPSVFNTGQILFGLSRMLEVSSSPDYIKAIHRAMSWLLENSKPNGGWKEGHYVERFLPTYYSRALWGMCVAGEHCSDLDWKPTVCRQLRYLENRIGADGQLDAAGFYPETPAFTHTIAYTLRGFLETALLLEDQACLQKLQQPVNRLYESLIENGKLAGRYTNDWVGDYSFKCLTGHAQTSLLFLRMEQVFQVEKYRLAAYQCFEEILSRQRLNSHPGSRGGLPGSSPIYGPYLPFKFPNWAVKFYLDALLQLYGLPQLFIPEES